MNPPARPSAGLMENSVKPSEKFEPTPVRNKPRVVVSMQPHAAPRAGTIRDELGKDRLLTAEEVAERLNVTKDWCGTIRLARPRICLSFGSGTARSVIAQAKSKNSLTKGSASPRCAASAGKIEAAHLFPHRN